MLDCSVIFRRFFFVALSVFVFLSSLSPCAQAGGKLVFIFDASGSMWGQIEGTAKIEIAREALSDLMKTIPADTDVGLVAYGHRRKGDCKDIEELVPLKPLDAEALIAAVQGIKPKGKTPMADSVQMVADKLKTMEEEASIILISDGKETCNADPCKLVETLKRAGIKFTLHVIGFDVGGETEDQLRCMAKAGGGEYFSAKNAGDFGKATKEALKKVRKNLKISVFLNGKPIGSQVDVTDPATGEQVANKLSSAKEPVLMNVKPGVYRITVTDEWVQEGRPKQVLEDIEITEDKVRELRVDFGAGTLEIRALKNGKPFKASVNLMTSDGVSAGSKVATPEAPAVFQLQPGSYKVVVEDSWGAMQKVDLGEVEIKAGESVKKEASFDTGKLVVWILKNGKPAHASVKLTDAAGKDEWVDTQEDRPATFEKMPGTYTCIAQDSWGTEARQDCGEVVIKGGETIEKKVSFDTGKLEIWILKSGKPAHARVKLIDSAGNDGWWTTYEDRPAVIEKNPGEYTCIAQDSWGSQLEQDCGTLTIKGGETTEKKVSFDTGTLVVWFYKDGKPYHGRVLFVEPDKKVWETTYEDRPAKFERAPGTYTVFLEDSWGDPVVRKEFGVVELKAGETLEKKWDFNAPPASPETSGTASPASEATGSEADVKAAGGSKGRIGVVVADRTGAPIIAYIRIVDIPNDNYAEEKDSAKEMSWIEVVPGTYQVDIECPDEKRVRSEVFDVQAGDEVSAKVDCDGRTAVLNLPSAGEKTSDAQPADTSLPQVADGRPLVGAQPISETVGAPPSTVDYSNVGAVDTGGGLDDEERPEQGPNPYAGMTPEQAQAQFSKDVGGIKRGPEHAFKAADYRLGSDYVSDARNLMAEMFSDLDEMKSEAAGLSGEQGAKVSALITKAEGNLESFAQKINSDASRETLQRFAYARGQELNGLRITIDNAK